MGGSAFGKRYEWPGWDSKLDPPGKNEVGRARQTHIGELRAVILEAHFKLIAALNLNLYR